MSNAAQKMAEAKHFLVQMDETQDVDDVFQYNLSAFLSAFKSIYYYLQTDFANNLDYQKWYKQKIKEYKGTVMEILVHKRDENVHTQPVVTCGAVAWQATWDITFGAENVGPLLEAGRLRRIGPNSYEITERPIITERTRKSFESVTGKDVVISCKEALRLAEADIEECYRLLPKV